VNTESVSAHYSWRGTIDYDVWGNETETLGVEPGYTRIPFGFAGGLYDPDTGLVRFGFRDYVPSIGRWAAKDATRFMGGLNLYVYSFDDPMNFRDPDGRDPTSSALGCVLAGGVGLLVGVGGLVVSAPAGGELVVLGPLAGGYLGAALGCGFGAAAGAAVPGWFAKGGGGNVADSGVEQQARDLVACGQATDMCDALDQLYGSTPPGPQRNKIKATQKAYGCRRRGGD
jgi:RHS repeat-associated protein